MNNLTKYQIGDILEANKDIKLSRWDPERCRKGRCMQVFQIKITIDEENKVYPEYELGYPESAVYFKLNSGEEFLNRNFKFIKNGKVVPCKEFINS